MDEGRKGKLLPLKNLRIQVGVLCSWGTWIHSEGILRVYIELWGDQSLTQAIREVTIAIFLTFLLNFPLFSSSLPFFFLLISLLTSSALLDTKKKSAVTFIFYSRSTHEKKQYEYKYSFLHWDGVKALNKSCNSLKILMMRWLEEIPIFSLKKKKFSMSTIGIMACFKCESHGIFLGIVKSNNANLLMLEKCFLINQLLVKLF